MYFDINVQFLKVLKLFTQNLRHFTFDLTNKAVIGVRFDY